ncbi:hypothetical protein C6497_10705 [Candidatus Poribacteria bacterium]|nr:MAG: hypothetical protein C6497_10705 [Candidatus Poribacteria bacterium]
MGIKWDYSMNSNGVLLAVEDQLSEAVATEILTRLGFVIQRSIVYKGFGSLKQKAIGLNQNARKPYDVFMLTDLDSPNVCPPTLIQSWVRGSLNPGFYLRVAVMEVESWVMADRQAFAEFLEISGNQIPTPTDKILDPKNTLLTLVKKSKSTTLRRELVRDEGINNLRIGPGYNPRLSEFIYNHWDIQRATSNSPSLGRTVNRLQT